MTEPVVHGGIDHAEFARLGLEPDAIIDFSVNSNPYGPSPAVISAVMAVDLSRYPDRACLALREAILAHELPDFGVSHAQIVCGNGAAELIWAIARAFLTPGDRAAILGPTFGEYRAATVAARAEAIAYPAHTLVGDAPDLRAISAWLHEARPRLVWLCNPNNPTGHWWDGDTVAFLAVICRGIGAQLVVDEAYLRFLIPAEVEAESAVSQIGDGVIVLRSLTKDYALAGVRLGYLVADAEKTARVAAQLPSWNVSGLAQAAGVAALADRAHFRRTMAQLATERGAFFAALRGTRFPVVSSRTHYRLVEVDNARAARTQLLARGMLVRDCASFGLPRHIRVATRPEWPMVIAALTALASDGSLPLPDGEGGGEVR